MALSHKNLMRLSSAPASSGRRVDAALAGSSPPSTVSDQQLDQREKHMYNKIERFCEKMNPKATSSEFTLIQMIAAEIGGYAQWRASLDSALTSALYNSCLEREGLPGLMWAVRNTIRHLEEPNFTACRDILFPGSNAKSRRNEAIKYYLVKFDKLWADVKSLGYATVNLGQVVHRLSCRYVAPPQFDEYFEHPPTKDIAANTALSPGQLIQRLQVDGQKMYDLVLNSVDVIPEEGPYRRVLAEEGPSRCVPLRCVVRDVVLAICGACFETKTVRSLKIDSGGEGKLGHEIVSFLGFIRTVYELEVAFEHDIDAVYEWWDRILLWDESSLRRFEFDGRACENEDLGFHCAHHGEPPELDSIYYWDLPSHREQKNLRDLRPLGFLIRGAPLLRLQIVDCCMENGVLKTILSETCKTVEEFVFNRNCITELDVAPFHRLRLLDLACNRLTDESARRLVCQLGHLRPGMKSLRLDRNMLYGDFFEWFATACGVGSLRELAELHIGGGHGMSNERLYNLVVNSTANLKRLSLHAYRTEDIKRVRRACHKKGIDLKVWSNDVPERVSF